MLAPIVLFVYNRLEHTIKTVEALQKNHLANESELFIFSDGPKDEASNKKVEEVRAYVKTISGFKKVQIFEKDKNWGLANSIIDGVTKIVNEYGRVIVLEDDLVTSPNFIAYMNEVLSLYAENDKVSSVCAFTPEIKIEKRYNNDTFFSNRASSWGWATWKNDWERVDWNIGSYKFLLKKKEFVQRAGDDLYYLLKLLLKGTIDSWATRWFLYHVINGKHSIYPSKSLVFNCGIDGSGVHCGKSNKFDVELDESFMPLKYPEIITDDNIMNRLMMNYHRYKMKDKIRRFIKELIGYRVKK